MEWTNVFDKLPPNKTLVLVCVVQIHPDLRIWRGIITAYFDYEKGWICPFSIETRITVKCWCECPEFPVYLREDSE